VKLNELLSEAVTIHKEDRTRLGKMLEYAVSDNGEYVASDDIFELEEVYLSKDERDIIGVHTYRRDHYVNAQRYNHITTLYSILPIKEFLKSDGRLSKFDQRDVEVTNMMPKNMKTGTLIGTMELVGRDKLVGLQPNPTGDFWKLEESWAGYDAAKRPLHPDDIIMMIIHVENLVKFSCYYQQQPGHQRANVKPHLNKMWLGKTDLVVSFNYTYSETPPLVPETHVKTEIEYLIIKIDNYMKSDGRLDSRLFNKDFSSSNNYGWDEVEVVRHWQKSKGDFIEIKLPDIDPRAA
jgi:hypothetical protein